MAADPRRPSWRAVKELLADALELPAEERPAFLARACAGDAALRAEVEGLLPDAATEERFLQRPASEALRGREPGPGDELGGYRLGRRLREGVLGPVFEASREGATVHLAVSRARLEGLDRARLAAALAPLTRARAPGLVRVVEAGTEDGSPPRAWIAFEPREGRPFLEHLAQARPGREDTLRLLARLADVVALAHRRGLRHGDLRAECVCIDGRGAPFVLDFGLAELADPLAASVRPSGEVVASLEHLSPEALLGEPAELDQRADVHALGTLAYRALTGRAARALDGLSLPQVALALQSDAAPAGELDPSLAGDLEALLATALARDPERRYPTASELAADLRRHLAGEPLAARPATSRYLIGILVRRHRALAAGLVLLALLALAGAFALGLRWAGAAR